MPWRCATLKCVRNLNRDLQRLIERQCALLQPLLQRLALEVLHHEKRGPDTLADVVERADVRMRELRDRAGFAVKALAKLWIGGQSLGEDLDRDRAIKTRVARFVDFPHAARADGRDDFERTQPHADREGQTGVDYTGETAARTRSVRINAEGDRFPRSTPESSPNGNVDSDYLNEDRVSEVLLRALKRSRWTESHPLRMIFPSGWTAETPISEVSNASVITFFRVPYP